MLGVVKLDFETLPAVSKLIRIRRILTNPLPRSLTRPTTLPQPQPSPLSSIALHQLPATPSFPPLSTAYLRSFGKPTNTLAGFLINQVLRLIRIQCVADSTDRLKKLGFLWLCLEFLTQARHMNINNPRVNYDLLAVSPYVL